MMHSVVIGIAAAAVACGAVLAVRHHRSERRRLLSKWDGSEREAQVLGERLRLCEQEREDALRDLASAQHALDIFGRHVATSAPSNAPESDSHFMHRMAHDLRNSQQTADAASHRPQLLQKENHVRHLAAGVAKVLRVARDLDERAKVLSEREAEVAAGVVLGDGGEE